jgi:aryl-alcohol dehydrogenase-like predicted oxidoreductase
MAIRSTTRRELLSAAALAAATGAACRKSSTPSSPDAAPPEKGSAPSETQAFPTRPLGKTGALVETVSLGGEGILRTQGGFDDAVPMILEAFRLGVRYCDTAPAYQQSQDYYGAALASAGPEVRKRIFLASKTHVRDRDGALKLLDDSLARLRTDHLDLWQMHDLRSEDDLDAIFAKDGAISAFEAAKADGRVRFVGITGHHRPDILVEAMRRYPVDTVLCAINPADPARLPFATSVIRTAKERGVGVIGMKVMAAGRLLADNAATPAELVRYAGSLCDTLIIGCSSIAEVRQNLALRAGFVPMNDDERSRLEARIAPTADRYDTFKASA